MGNDISVMVWACILWQNGHVLKVCGPDAPPLPVLSHSPKMTTSENTFPERRLAITGGSWLVRLQLHEDVNTQSFAAVPFL